MKKVCCIKGIEFSEYVDSIVSNKISIVDVPLNLRYSDCKDFIDSEKIISKCDFEDAPLVIADKLSLMKQVIERIDSNILKNLSVIVLPQLKNCNEVVDFMLVRYNRVFVIQFGYDLLSVTNHPELKPAKISFRVMQIEQTLKRYLPTDSVVRTFLFMINDDHKNSEVIMQLVREISNFYDRTTAKELYKLIL